jgi:demethylmenaquinone methyltransferase/2-methoxy-6-polyprenyl-1,4-benzoquinol methylase
MRAYYAQRAHSYERIYAKPERQADLRRLETLLPALFDGRRVLEVACGTGYWIPFGAARCASWHATDLNEETLQIARSKALPARVRLQRCDAYTLDGLEGGGFDAAFAGFWWSHVAHRRLSDWLATLHARLEPGARVVLLDNRFVEGSSTPISRRDGEGNSYQQRPLDDGSTHEVLKNFPGRDAAFVAIAPDARDAHWTEFDHYWLLDYILA